MLNKARLRIRLSGAGKTLSFLAVFLLFAAQNTGNNLLYLMSSCFFACLVMSCLVSLRNMTGLKVDLLLPDFCFAGEEIIMRCRIEDRIGRFHRCLAFEDDYIDSLAPDSMVILRTSFAVPLRGQFLVKQFKLFSCYPVDIFFTSLELPPDAVAVGPTPARSVPEMLSVDAGGVIQKQVSGKEGDYWMQSHYQEGEDASLINWTISARSFNEWVLVRSISLGHASRLQFDFTGLSSEGFENGLKLISGLLLKWRRSNSEVLLWANSFRRGGYAWLSIRDDMPRIVRWLACLTYGETVPPADGENETVRMSQWLGKNA